MAPCCAGSKRGRTDPAATDLPGKPLQPASLRGTILVSSALAPAAVPPIAMAPIAVAVTIAAAGIIGSDDDPSGNDHDRPAIGMATPIRSAVPTRATPLSGVRPRRPAQHGRDGDDTKKRLSHVDLF